MGRTWTAFARIDKKMQKKVWRKRLFTKKVQIQSSIEVESERSNKTDCSLKFCQKNQLPDLGLSNNFIVFHGKKEVHQKMKK